MELLIIARLSIRAILSDNYRLLVELVIVNTILGTILILTFRHYRIFYGCQFPVEPIVWVILISLIYYGELDGINKYIGLAFTFGEVYFVAKAVLTGLYTPFIVSLFFGVMASIAYQDLNGLFNIMAPGAVLITVAVYRRLNLTLGMSIFIAYLYVSVYSVLLSLVCIDCLEKSNPEEGEPLEQG